MISSGLKLLATSW